MIDNVHKLLDAGTGSVEEADCNLLAVMTAAQERPLATQPAPFRIVLHDYGWSSTFGLTRRYSARWPNLASVLRCRSSMPSLKHAAAGGSTSTKMQI